MTDLHAAAQAVVDRWDTPLWKDVPHTAEYINALREALADELAVQAAPETRTLSEEQIERHQMPAGACPPSSEVMLVSAIRRLLGLEAAPSVVEPVAWRYALDASVEGPRWIYIDKDPCLWLRGPGERNAPIEPLFRAAHPPRAPLSVDAAVKTLVDALIESKGWMRSYADALVRSAIDRDEWPPRAPLTDEEIKSIFCRSVKAAELDGGFPHIFARAVLAASGGGE